MRERAELRRGQHLNEVRHFAGVARAYEKEWRQAVDERNAAIREAHGEPKDGKVTYRELVTATGLAKGTLRKIVEGKE